jgi:hypothetical protein
LTTTSTPTTPDLAAALTIAASLVTAAAHTAPASAHDVSIAVSGIAISIQIPEHTGDVRSRAATVAAYADVLDAPVRRRDSAWDSWIEAHGARSGYLIHVWTVLVRPSTDPLTDDREEAHPTA